MNLSYQGPTEGPAPIINVADSQFSASGGHFSLKNVVVTGAPSEWQAAMYLEGDVVRVQRPSMV
jgi:hypothetical protein